MDAGTAAEQQVIAAWVQAIGSIGAIVAALGVVILQNRLEARRSKSRQKERDAGFVAGVEALAQTALDLFNRLHIETEARDRHQGAISASTDGDLEAVAAMLDRIPVHDVPRKGIVPAVFRLRALIGDALDGLQVRTWPGLGGGTYINIDPKQTERLQAECNEIVIQLGVIAAEVAASK